MSELKKFRKKPVIVEAEQFIASKEPWPTGVYLAPGLVGYEMSTPGGTRKISDGDWIINGAKGCRYPCDKEIFEMYYEAV